MTKGPVPRHSKPSEPPTIDLDATDVTPRDIPPVERPESASAASASGPTGDPAGEPADTGPRDRAGETEPEVAGGGAQADSPLPGSLDAKDAGGSALAAAAAGGAGGAVVFALLYALQAGGFVPPPGGAGSDALRAELAAVQQDLTELSGRVDRLPADSGAELATLSHRLETLEQTAASAADGAPDTTIAALDERLATLAQQVEELGRASRSAETGTGDPAALDNLRTRVETLSADLAVLGGETGQIEQSLAALEEKLAESTGGLSQRIEAMQARMAEPDRTVDLARAIATTGLKAAIDRGGPFAEELEAFASVAPDDPAVAELREFAASGVPTRAQLLAAFPAAADRMIAATQPADPDAGIIDRLLESAKSMVRVRKVGQIEGDSVEAIAARIETALANGSVAGALSEWNRLPDAARAAAPDFAAGLAARAEVDKLMAGALLPAPSREGSDQPAGDPPDEPAGSGPANQE